MSAGVTYLAPRSLDEALAALRDLDPAATVLAGGQDVVPLMNRGRLVPAHLVDISRLDTLAAITDTGVITIGPLVTHDRLMREPVIGERFPLLVETVGQIGGGVQVRNRGTIGGAVCAANPAYDLPASLVALEAVFVLASSHGPRRISASDFVTGAGRTARRSDELLIGIEVPPPADSSSAYVKLKFMEGGYTIAGAACLLALDGDRICTQARLVLSGVTETPIRVPEVERALVGIRITRAALERVAAGTPAAIVHPISDVMAPADYRRAMAGVVAARAVAQAAMR